ncbi:MAG TPA: PhoPQ-activated protein PqaA family protein, partial [Gemmataceae bacterium]|nr:PhoPQ-activated protein PqaA family protein [Gemmataceae bacterium]
LAEYLRKPEPAFEWILAEKIERDGDVIYKIQLISQKWHNNTWAHALVVCQPKGVRPRSLLLLRNQGGQPKPETTALDLELARKAQAPCACLYGIPNQPLLGGKKEDALIAETFVRYLDSKDENWPLLFPMVKSMVKAMDALQAFARQEWKTSLEGFVVTGASKRGWTTWLTGASDPRVKAIAPMVIDTLNMRKQMDHQLDTLGAYSDQIHDFTERGLVPVPKTPTAERLWKMVDPYFYRDRLTMPKLLINGNNDPYWSTDALNLYWDGLKGDKWLLYVPNAGHNLEQKNDDGKPDRSRALHGLAAFARHAIHDKPMPKLTWKHDDAGGKARLTLHSTPPPKGGRLWLAEAPTRDFRKAKWVSRPLDDKAGGAVLAPPAKGFIAFYAELDYALDDLPYHLSTTLRVMGK